ncbi:unnamed protein product, partial [Nesidiocoris tenuis]
MGNWPPDEMVPHSLDGTTRRVQWVCWVSGCRVTGGRRCNIHYWRFVRYTFRENHREPNGGQT